MLISELARRTGVSVHALRHYERLGLLRPARTTGGYRDYAEPARREVVFIAMSRKIGFSLKAIAERLPAYRSGRLGLDDMIAAMHGRIAEIDGELAALQAQRAQVVDHVRWLRDQQKKSGRARPRASAKPWPSTRPSQRKELP